MVYMIIATIRNKKRCAILDKYCDPETFLEKTIKQTSINGRNRRFAAYMAIDKAAAYITLGEFKEAEIILESIDKQYLSEKNNTLLIYTINRILCSYELGNNEKAERLFERQLTILPALSQDLRNVIRILIGERYYFLGKYDESQEYLMKLLKTNFCKRRYLSILYRLAQIDEIKDKTADAKEKYREVAGQGNKLWIAKQAGERLTKLSES